MKRWAIFFGLFIVLVIVLADTGHLGGVGKIYDFPGGDKVGHFVLFGLLSFVINLSVFEARPLAPLADKGWLALISSLILAVFVGLEEYSQRFFPVRSSDIFDFLASCAGIAFFAWLTVKLKTLNKNLK
jgi:VanZ family protein